MAEVIVAEVWRACPGFPEYSVSNRGRVRREVDSHATKAGRIIKCCPCKNGYLYASLHRSGKRRNCLVHRLVALAFLGDPPDGKPQVNHKNACKADNRIENLEWASPQDDGAHRVQMGLSRKGESHGLAKLSDESVRELRRRIHDGESSESLALELGVSKAAISLALNRLTWKHVE